MTAPRYVARSLICCDPPGDVVMASDYDALAAERDALRSRLREVVALLWNVRPFVARPDEQAEEALAVAARR